MDPQRGAWDQVSDTQKSFGHSRVMIQINLHLHARQSLPLQEAPFKFFICGETATSRPHSQGCTIVYAYAMAEFVHMGMHRCFLHPCAGSPIHVTWDAAVTLTQPLLPI